jgi:hypothetical protein
MGTITTCPHRHAGGAGLGTVRPPVPSPNLHSITPRRGAMTKFVDIAALVFALSGLLLFLIGLF